ncbi:MAG: hypothetical protein ATN36_03995 [Epulopiscium sp. Nele67-Bin005]|nr:MAG: hypothetical protein ATN36_03995 [Epulopiscium sp. Nele67-Bin005]
MGKKRTSMILAIGALGIGAFAFSGIIGQSSNKEVVMVGPADASKIVSVDYAQLQDIETKVTVSGTIEAQNSETVFSETSNQILTIHKEFADPVTKGEVIMTLDAQKDIRDNYQRELENINLQIANAQIRLTQVGDDTTTEIEILQAKNSVAQAEKAIQDLNDSIASIQKSMLLIDGDIASASIDIESAGNDINLAKNNIELAENTVRNAENDVYLAEANTLAAQDDLKTAQANLDLQQTLFDEGFGSQFDLDTAQNNYNKALLNYDNLKNTEVKMYDAYLNAQNSYLNIQNAYTNTQNAQQKIQHAYDRTVDSKRALQDDITNLENNRAVLNLQLETAQYQYKLLTNQVSDSVADRMEAQSKESIQNEIKMYNIQKETINQQIADLKTTVVAPASGTVDTILVDEGSYISVGTPLMKIVDAENLKITANISTFYASQLVEGLDATVKFDGSQIIEVPARITKVSPTATTEVGSTSATIPIELEILGDTTGLKAGVSVDVTVMFEQIHDVISVPLLATMRDSDDNSYVFVVGEDFSLEKRYVTEGSANNRYISVSDLEIGEIVVTNPTEALEDGMFVNYKPLAPLVEETEDDELEEDAEENSVENEDAEDNTEDDEEVETENEGE